MLVARLALIGPAILAMPIPQKLNLLVFSKTRGFRHDSIPSGRRAIYKLAEKNGWTVTYSEDSTWFSDSKLKAFDTVVFLNTTGDVLEEDQQKAMENYIHSGGGYMGIHSASDTEYDWPWYGQLVGAWFKRHPQIQEAKVKIEDPNHPAMKGLPNPWTRTDEWYDFRENPRSKVHVLASMDVKSYQNSEMVDDHPMVWCHDFEGGRSFYCEFGHTKESYSDPLYLQILREGIKWAAGKRKK